MSKVHVNGPCDCRERISKAERPGEIVEVCQGYLKGDTPMTNALNAREDELSMQVIELKTEIHRMRLCAIEDEKRRIRDISEAYEAGKAYGFQKRLSSL